MKNIILFVVVPLVVLFLAIVISEKFSEERTARIKAEQELLTTREALEDLCKNCIKEKNCPRAKITYQAYFGKPVDHSGDGFIDGYE